MTGMIATFTVLLLVAADKSEAQPPAGPSIRQALATLDYSAVPISIGKQETAPAPAPKPSRSIGRKIAGGALGTVLGFIAGAYAWELVTSDCKSCEPAPLPNGVIYGGPIGAAIGFSLGVKYF